MELKTFVAESIRQISEGIQEAQSTTNGAWISPCIRFEKEGAVTEDFTGGAWGVRPMVFDVAVTACESQDKKGEAGIKILGISAGGSGAESVCNSTVSRIRFEIPVGWPVGKRPKG